MKDVTRSEEPQDRLGRIAADVLQAVEVHPEYADTVQAIVMLNDDATKRGVVALSGYEKDSEAVAQMFVHLQAVFEANGQKLLLASLGEG